MRICPNCKAELDDSARFCLRCMTSLENKQQIEPPKRDKRWWPLVLVICVIICAVAIALALWLRPSQPQGDDETPTTTATTTTTTVTTTTATTTTTTTTPVTDNSDEGAAMTYTVDGVAYTFRRATRDEYPTAISFSKNYTLIRVEGVPIDGIYRVPTFVGEDMTAIVSVVAEGAFEGTGATMIDLGYNVRYVRGDAFSGCVLTKLYLHNDTLIERATLDGCSQELTIHCPSYIENTQGEPWSELAVRYGFKWQEEII